MRHVKAHLPFFLLGALIVGCVGNAPPPQTEVVTQAPERRAASRNVLTGDDLDATRFRTAFEVVEALRPHWLRIRGNTSLRAVESVKVYLDDSLLGTPEQLKQVTTASIASIRFMDGPEASVRWGLDHGHGAIILSTRRDPRP